MAGLIRSRGSAPAKSIETARQRRAKRQDHGSRKPAARSRSVKASSGQVPVLSRRDVTGMAASPRRSNRPRRRYDVALNIPGAEVRLPSLPALHLSWRIASAWMVGMMLLAGYLLGFSTFFQVDVVEVSGLKRLALVDINTALGISGQQVIAVDPDQVQHNLQTAFPELASVKVSVGLPAHVKLEVVERQPVITWNKGGTELWLDKDGVTFPPRGKVGSLVRLQASQLPGMTVKEGVQESYSLSPDTVALILTLGKNMPDDNPVVYDEKYGFGWVDDRGWQVYFGRSSADIDQKLLVYKSIVERLEGEGIQPALISMEYLHAPYYRLEP